MNQILVKLAKKWILLKCRDIVDLHYRRTRSAELKQEFKDFFSSLVKYGVTMDEVQQTVRALEKSGSLPELRTIDQIEAYIVSTNKVNL